MIRALASGPRGMEWGPDDFFFRGGGGIGGMGEVCDVILLCVSRTQRFILIRNVLVSFLLSFLLWQDDPLRFLTTKPGSVCPPS